MNLAKGNTLNLAKGAAATLPIFKLGASWDKKGKKLFGIFGGKHKSVDLDLCSFAVADGKIVKECSFQNKNAGYMVSSGDDRSGGGSEDKDNEIITLDMSKVPANIDAIIMIINSFSGEKFDEIDYAKIRVYEGQDNVPTKVHCSYNVASDPSFIGGRTLIIGSIFRNGDGWDFKAIGEMRSYQYIRDFKREVESA